eukprot:5725104-Pyramimonas_sp.AAC.1
MVPFCGHGPYWVNIWCRDRGSEQCGFRFGVPLRADLPSDMLDHFSAWVIDEHRGLPDDDIVVEALVEAPASHDNPDAAEHDDSRAVGNDENRILTPIPLVEELQAVFGTLSE